MKAVVIISLAAGLLLAACVEKPKRSLSDEVGVRNREVRISEARIEIPVVKVERDIFTDRGAMPLLGRTFNAEDFNGEPDVAVLSYALWNQQCGRRADIVGISIEIDGRLAVVIAVAPPTDEFPDAAVLWKTGKD